MFSACSCQKISLYLIFSGVKKSSVQICNASNWKHTCFFFGLILIKMSPSIHLKTTKKWILYRTYQTRDCHTGFLFANDVIEKHNKMFCYLLVSSNYQTTEWQQYKHMKFEILPWSKSKVQEVFVVFLHTELHKQETKRCCKTVCTVTCKPSIETSDICSKSIITLLEIYSCMHN